MLSQEQQQKAAKNFSDTWMNKTGYEKGESQPFWCDLLCNVFGIQDFVNYINFEEQVKIDNTAYIDGYIPSTRVLIEQKSADKDLRAPIQQSNGAMLDPFKQAQRYILGLPVSRHPRWVVTCNFKSFLVYDMEQPNAEPEEIFLENLEKEFYRLSFLVNPNHVHLKREMELSIKAGDIVGEIYDTLKKQYKNPDSPKTLKSLNMLCVRLVFCLYAEDAGLFNSKSQFHDYIETFRTENIHYGLSTLFKVLDTPKKDRDEELDDKLAAFPYVNGGLFSEEGLPIPQFNEKLRNLLLENASENFDWSDISPTIFGAVFESTLNPETRRKGGMHYTSIENIHKVIDPLFLDDLKGELQEIKKIDVFSKRKSEILKFQKKLSSLKFLDPACGSGNFLTESYLSLALLEIEALKATIAKDEFVVTGQNKVSIHQFYGIEINDFAVTVAKTALWIAESQVSKHVNEILLTKRDFLPLKSYVNIIEGNALQMDWESVVSKKDVSYIMGNPPFIGYKEKNTQQKEDLKLTCVGTNGKAIKNVDSLDYVSGWYYKAMSFIRDTKIEVALVSTNSITQGEQVSIMWKPLIEDLSLSINFAYRTFRWDSEAKLKAHVHCVIIGFSEKKGKSKNKYIFEGKEKTPAKFINPYLYDADTIWIKSRRKPICNTAKQMLLGVHIFDNHNFIFSLSEKNDFVKKEPYSEKFFKEWVSADDFINNTRRYYLDLSSSTPDEFDKMPLSLELVRKVLEYRNNNNSSKGTPLAKHPFKTKQGWKANAPYIIVPNTSSEKRKYLPIMFMPETTVVSMPDLAIPNGDFYDFGILASSVHTAWIKTVCGRNEMRFRYSNGLVYNNFPWPNPTIEQRNKIIETAKEILMLREKYKKTSLANLYGDKMFLYEDLVKAHENNDKAVKNAYGFSQQLTERECVVKLLKMYERISKKEKK